jgi:beta-lactamase class A
MPGVIDLFAQLTASLQRRRPLPQAFAAIARSSRGEVGITALDLASGESVSLNGERSFPMASLVKVPIAIAAMKQVDAGRLHMEQMVALRPSHICPGHGMLGGLPVPGVSVSLKNLLQLSIIHSDNTASDAILDAIGGACAVAECFPGVRIHRPLRSVLSEMIGVTLPPNTVFTKDMWKRATDKPYPPARAAALEAFFNDPRDTATTAGMCEVLAGLWRGDGMSRHASQFILDAMGRCRTGAQRLKAGLPKQIRFAHKTGSLLDKLTADMGIFEGPELPRPIAVCAFVMHSTASQRQQDRVLAELGAAIFRAAKPGARLGRGG